MRDFQVIERDGTSITVRASNFSDCASKYIKQSNFGISVEAIKTSSSLMYDITIVGTKKSEYYILTKPCMRVLTNLDWKVKKGCIYPSEVLLPNDIEKDDIQWYLADTYGTEIFSGSVRWSKGTWKSVPKLEFYSKVGCGLCYYDWRDLDYDLGEIERVFSALSDCPSLLHRHKVNVVGKIFSLHKTGVCYNASMDLVCQFVMDHKSVRKFNCEKFDLFRIEDSSGYHYFWFLR